MFLKLMRNRPVKQHVLLWIKLSEIVRTYYANQKITIKKYINNNWGNWNGVGAIRIIKPATRFSVELRF